MLDSTASQNIINLDVGLPLDAGVVTQQVFSKTSGTRLNTSLIEFDQGGFTRSLGQDRVEAKLSVIPSRWAALESLPTRSAAKFRQRNCDSLTGMDQEESLTKSELSKLEFTKLEFTKSDTRTAQRFVSVSSRRSRSQLRATQLFNSISGYGFVDAAKTVARSLNLPAFTAVPDIGGNNWGLDLLKAPEVWAKGYTGQGVTVAVIDSGVDITHPDLQGNIWVNSREIAGDGIDNDGNSYVDDVNGWNFGVGQNNNNVMPGTSDPGQNHGTHVAGTIAAKNNGVGATGVAPNAKIMALRLGDVSGNIFVNGGNLAQAIRYAVDNGAKVINMSLGWTGSAELQSAFAYAASKNVITISASGNEGFSTPGTPARYATQFGLSVGAVNRDRNVAFFSNGAGSNRRLQHVVAPGVQIYSTLPNGAYGFLSGTSMATPHVAGMTALMFSANPTLTHAQVRQFVTESASNTSRLA